MCVPTAAAFMWTKNSALLPRPDTQDEYLRSSALCPRHHTSLNPSLQSHRSCSSSLSRHPLFSPRLPANSPFCISSLSSSIRLKTSKPTLSCRMRTKGAAFAQRNPLKCKTTEESVDKEAARQTAESWSHSQARRRCYQCPAKPWLSFYREWDWKYF